MDSIKAEELRREEVAMFSKVGAKAGTSGAGRSIRLSSALALLSERDRALVLWPRSMRSRAP